MMKTQILIKVSGIILLGIAVSLAALVLAYALQHPHLLAMLFTVSWNG
jgi:hypothetical protein